MKQIFDWLREHMQERIKLYQTLDVTETAVDVAIKETERFIEYINEAEAKWEAECCIRVIGKPFTSSCGQKYDKWTYVGEPYCAKCGKPIKISEVE